MNRPDVDRGNWDFTCLKELKECFKRTNCRCLYANTMGSLINILIHYINKVIGDFSLKLINLFFVISSVEL